MLAVPVNFVGVDFFVVVLCCVGIPLALCRLSVAIVWRPCLLLRRCCVADVSVRWCCVGIVLVLVSLCVGAVCGVVVVFWLHWCCVGVASLLSGRCVSAVLGLCSCPVVVIVERCMCCLDCVQQVPYR